MLNLFIQDNKLDSDKKISFHNGFFSEIVDEIKEKPNKLLIINSALHHVIWLEEMLDDIKASMRSGDMFILGREPNNNYSR